VPERNRSGILRGELVETVRGSTVHAPARLNAVYAADHSVWDGAPSHHFFSKSNFIANQHARGANANKRAAPALLGAGTPDSGAHGALPLASGDMHGSHVHSIRAYHGGRNRNNGDTLPRNRLRARKAKH